MQLLKRKWILKMNFDENFSSFSFSNGGERSISFFSGDVFSCRVLRMEGEFGKTNTPHLINIIPFFFWKNAIPPFWGFVGSPKQWWRNKYRKQIYKAYIKISVHPLPFLLKETGGLNVLPNFLKRGGLTGPQLLERCCCERGGGGDLFRGGGGGGV